MEDEDVGVGIGLSLALVEVCVDVFATSCLLMFREEKGDEVLVTEQQRDYRRVRNMERRPCELVIQKKSRGERKCKD